MSEQKIYARLTTSPDLSCATLVIASNGRMTLEDINDAIKDYLVVVQDQMNNKDCQ